MANPKVQKNKACVIKDTPQETKTLTGAHTSWITN